MNNWKEDVGRDIDLGSPRILGGVIIAYTTLAAALTE
jgi:hypothetical protein